MSSATIFLAALIVILTLNFAAQISSFQNVSCNSNDLIALKGFSKCLQHRLNFSGSDCCTWNGVTCQSISFTGQTRVTKLELASKGLSGILCESLADLDQLRVLNLSDNFLYGHVPDRVFSLMHLEVLDLSRNGLSGSVPSIIYLPSITHMDISNNKFSGQVPTSLGSCTTLQYLYLHVNSLAGGFPETTFQLKNLSVLNLEDNNFIGPVSNGIGNLANLVTLRISSNRFSGTLPDIFQSLVKLEIFSAASNHFTSPVPASLLNSRSLSVLKLSNNSLNGTIHLNCSAMINLSILGLSSNPFLSPLLDHPSSCRRLSVLNLSVNKRMKKVPYSFKNLQALTKISLSNASLTNISEALEILLSCKNLSSLILPTNFFGEEIPQDANIKFCNLEVLALGNSRLRGSIPQWLSGCSKLLLLDLSSNNLEGKIPNWLGNFKFLFHLDLSNNSFTGHIPKGLTQLESFINRSISYSNPALDFPLVSSEKGRSRIYTQTWSFPPSLDLSNNMLTGPILQEFGRLKKLHVLKLKNNRLFGNIPKSLSAMASLESLDLSNNKLSGEIPNALVQLSFLSIFNVSYNKLSGKVPSGGQFDTFPASSFEGNEGLCGGSFIICIPKEGTNYPNSTDESTGYHMKIIGIPFMIGASTAFVLTIHICFLSGWVFPKADKKKNRIVNRRRQR